MRIMYCYESERKVKVPIARVGQNRREINEDGKVLNCADGGMD